MSGDAWTVLVVLVGVVVLLAAERVRTVVGLGGGLFVLLVTGAADDDTVLSGLASLARPA